MDWLILTAVVRFILMYLPTVDIKELPFSKKDEMIADEVTILHQIATLRSLFFSWPVIALITFFQTVENKSYRLDFFNLSIFSIFIILLLYFSLRFPYWRLTTPLIRFSLILLLSIADIIYIIVIFPLLIAPETTSV